MLLFRIKTSNTHQSIIIIHLFYTSDYFHKKKIGIGNHTRSAAVRAIESRASETTSRETYNTHTHTWWSSKKTPPKKKIIYYIFLGRWTREVLACKSLDTGRTAERDGLTRSQRLTYRFLSQWTRCIHIKCI